MKPLFKHDCDGCIYIKSQKFFTKPYDGYYCPESGSLVIRYGDRPDNYESVQRFFEEMPNNTFYQLKRLSSTETLLEEINENLSLITNKFKRIEVKVRTNIFYLSNFPEMFSFFKQEILNNIGSIENSSYALFDECFDDIQNCLRILKEIEKDKEKAEILIKRIMLSEIKKEKL